MGFTNTLLENSYYCIFPRDAQPEIVEISYLTTIVFANSC
jgi:hypothetical protein